MEGRKNGGREGRGLDNRLRKNIKDFTAHRSEDHVEWHRDVEVESVVVDHTDTKVQHHHVEVVPVGCTQQVDGLQYLYRFT